MKFKLTKKYSFAPTTKSHFTEKNKTRRISWINPENLSRFKLSQTGSPPLHTKITKILSNTRKKWMKMRKNWMSECFNRGKILCIIRNCVLETKLKTRNSSGKRNIKKEREESPPNLDTIIITRKGQEFLQLREILIPPRATAWHSFDAFFRSFPSLFFCENDENY